MRCPEDAGEDCPTRSVAPVQLERATSALANETQVRANVMWNIRKARRIASLAVKDATSEPCTLGTGKLL